MHSLVSIKAGISKLKIDIIKIFQLGEKNKIDGKIRLKPDKIEKTLTWLIF